MSAQAIVSFVQGVSFSVILVVVLVQQAEDGFEQCTVLIKI